MRQKDIIFLAIVCLLRTGWCLNEGCKPRQEGIRTCSKSCARENCKSARKECLCDGVCGLSCINKNMRCVNLGRRIPNGRVSIVPFNKFGAVAKYTCNDGYDLKGLAIRVCQGNEDWSGQEPRCVLTTRVPDKTECGSPPDVANADYYQNRGNSTYPLGTMLEYTCRDGFQKGKDDADKAWCVGMGTWVGPRMKCYTAGCPKPKAIENGGIREPFVNGVGAIMSYYCNPGFHLAGRPTRECRPSGVWDGKEPSCEKVTCGSPPLISNAQHDGPMQPRYSAGFQLTYNCDMGYIRESDPRIMCGDDGDWTRIDLRCLPVNCGFPGELDNGWRSGHVFHYPESIQYHCHDGYELRGSPNRTCQANAEWSGLPPTCDAVDCPILEEPKNGTMIGAGNAYGTIIQFKCNDKFHLSGSAERRCQADRTWSGTDAQCLAEITCIWPSTFWNGYVLGEKTGVGSTVFFSCHVRTKFVGDYFDATCLPNGTWSHPPPTCWGQCQVPSIEKALLEGVSQGAWRDHGTYLRYSCVDGFIPLTSKMLTCNNGTWSALPQCVPAPCRDIPPPIHNGLRIYTGRQNGRKAKYICLNGYRLAGMDVRNATLVCQEGRWIGGTPSCERVFCPNPGLIDHGKIYKLEKYDVRFEFKTYIKEIPHGQRLGFECNAGYMLKGASGATCIDGRWNPPLGGAASHCEEARHLPFPRQWHPVFNANYHVK